MANLQETSTWEAGIYQLETSDPVMGGENGIDNRAPRQLANRTLWLKNELSRQIGLVNSGKLGKTENAVSATKLFTARNIAMTGDGSWNVSFDGSQNATGALTLANSGVTAGSYNSVTVDAKGRVTAGLTQTHGLVTATTATGTANTATTNTNTFLNIVASGVGRASSVGSSTQITGTNGVSVSSDTAGALTLSGTRATDTAVGVTMLSHNTNGMDKTKAASEFALGEVRRMANQAQVTADGIALTWNNVQNKPTTFTPSSHTHAWSQIVGVPSASTAVAGIVQLNNTLTSTATNQALTANMGKMLDESKLGNSGHQTINGQLGITSNAWEKLRFTNSDGSFWRFDSPSVSSGEDGARLNYVFFGSNNNEVGRISFPRVSSGETIAYQSWVRTANVASANRLATARTITMTGDGSWNVNFDGSGNPTATMTLSNSGVTAGSYNSVTVDAKGRVTRGLTQTHGLVTATTATGTTNTATTNTNTFLNIVASGVGSTASVGSSTQITGTNGITVSSDTAGKVIITRDSNSPTATRLATAHTISLTGAVTGSVNFDGSGNVSMATTLTKAVVRDYNSSFNSSVGSSNYNIVISGQVVATPDGRITQYIHVQHFRDFWFPMNENSVGNYAGEGTRSRLLQIPLWTAMPNKILSVSAQAMRSTNTAQSAGFFGEAAEHQVAWAKRQQGVNKTHAFVEMARITGGASEEIDMFIVVEGY